MTLLETTVLRDVVKVVTTNNDGSLHLHLGDNSSQNTTSDRDIAGEGTFLVDVGSLNCLEWGVEGTSWETRTLTSLGVLKPRPMFL